MRVADVNRLHSAKQRRAWAAKTLGREDNALICSLDVLGSKIPTIVKFDAFPQEEGVRLAVLRNLPTVRQVWNDGLTTITGVTPDQIVVHAALRAHVGDGS